MDNIREAYEEMLVELTMKDLPKIKATVLNKAQNGKRLAKEFEKYFQSMINNVDDLEGKDGVRLMNAEGALRNAAKKLGFS
jgi:hypothetical protein